MTRRGAPIAFGGRLVRKWQRTAPELPWGRATRPQITRMFEPLICFLALYTYVETRHTRLGGPLG